MLHRALQHEWIIITFNFTDQYIYYTAHCIFPRHSLLSFQRKPELMLQEFPVMEDLKMTQTKENPTCLSSSCPHFVSFLWHPMVVLFHTLTFSPSVPTDSDDIHWNVSSSLSEAYKMWPRKSTIEQLTFDHIPLARFPSRYRNLQILLPVFLQARKTWEASTKPELSHGKRSLTFHLLNRDFVTGVEWESNLGHD